MEQDLDLRPYIEAAVHQWYWVFGAGLVVAIIVFAISSMLKPIYEAKALVVIAEPRQRVQFDPRIDTVVDDQPLRAYPELALSDHVLNTVLSQIEGIDELDLTDFRGLLEAEAGNDPSLLYLSVRHTNPEMAAKIADVWATYFASWVNKVYGTQGTEQLVFFEEQKSIAQAELSEAEQVLISFQGRNRLSIVVSELVALEFAQAAYLREKQDFIMLLKDVSSLRTQLSEQPDAEQSSTADQLVVIILQLKAFNLDVQSVSDQPSNSGLPIQFQMDADAFSDISNAEHVAILSTLEQTVMARIAGIDQEIQLLEPRLLELQLQKQEMESEQTNVTRNYEIAQETFTALARKVEEERIVSQDSSGVRYASEGVIPSNPVGPRPLFNAILAGFAGLMLSMLAVLGRFWWRLDSAMST